mmetsp:Transcript_78421/g.237876  ORF Transcript_78421/g.237876 Transcript_78421/m.237876 type:complete len:253 (+) Transcript_78421:26-784(+)
MPPLLPAAPVSQQLPVGLRVPFGSWPGPPPLHLAEETLPRAAWPRNDAATAATPRSALWPGPALVSLRHEERLRAELQESLSEEAELEAAVAQKRSHAILQASRIAALERSTAELLRRRDAEACLMVPVEPSERSASSAQSPTPPSAVVALRANDAADEDDDGAGHDAEGEPGEDGEASNGLSLEAATAQVSRLCELRRQVACLEEELEARSAEVEHLSMQLGSREAHAQQQQSFPQALVAPHPTPSDLGRR